MSRVIEQERIESGKLSEDEKLYLQDRGQLPRGVEPAQHPDATVAVEDIPHTGDVNTAGVTKEELQLLIKLRKAEQGAADAEDEVDDYAELTTKELRAELSRRGLSIDGVKKDLVARLEEDDESEEDEEDEDSDEEPEA